ncbi:MAG: methionyl-tRNA formyltransferase, partial [Coriobacteriia bacterium]|nr:methionyl-tRNA formyltransferase [Coriobacteriia bacterium]
MKYVIASNRIWNRRMPQALAARVPAEFTWIDKPEELTVKHLGDIGPRYIFFPHWSFMIPQAIYEAFECVVFHMTDVPYGRGGSPL